MSTKVKDSLSIIYLEDDESTREDMGELLDRRLQKDLEINRTLEVKIVPWNKKAIDAMSMAEGKSVLLSNLMISSQYPFQVWEYAAESQIPIIIVSAYDLTRDRVGAEFDYRMRELRKKFPLLDLSSIYKIQPRWPELVLEQIKAKFPGFFKKEYEPRDMDLGEGKRK